MRYRHAPPPLLLAALLLLAPLVGAATAQPTDTFVVAGLVDPKSRDVALYEISADGKRLSTFAVLPTDMYPRTLIQGTDNATIRIIGRRNSAPWENLIMDVARGGAISSVRVGAPFFSLVTARPDQNGDWIVFDKPQNVDRYIDTYRLSGRTLTRLSRSVPSLHVFGAVQDETAGDLVVTGITGYGDFQKVGYYRMDPVTAAITTMFLFQGPSAAPAAAGLRSIIAEPERGTFVDLCNHPQSTLAQLKLVRFIPGQGVTLFPHQPVTPWASVSDLTEAGQRDRQAAYYLLERWSTYPHPYMLSRIAPDGFVLGRGEVKDFMVLSASSLLRRGGRHLAWELDRYPNDRSLRLSFPGEGGLPYVVGLSLKGVRPGPMLADGRRIPLVPDALTALGLGGDIPGILQGLLGRLDAKGEARARIHLNAFGPAIYGLEIWAAALVLDPRAPSGVAYIAGPKFMRVDEPIS